MSKSIHDRKQQLQAMRQSILFRVFYIILLLGFVGGSMTSIFNNGLRRFPMLVFISILFVFFGSFAISLFFVQKKIHNLNKIDHILFGFGCIIYFFAIFIGNAHMLLVIMIIFPIFLLLFITLLRRKQVFIYLCMNMVIVAFLFIKNPIETVSLSSIYYIQSLFTLLTVLYSADKLVSILVEYQNNIYDHNQELSMKNTELRALNEEYYATQEELHDQYDQIQYAAYNDELTGFFNRIGFHLNSKGLLNVNNHGLYLICIDIDKFSEINSAYGYEIGDQVLIQVSNRIVETLPTAINPARVGNDIFAFIIDSSNMETQLHLCLDALKDHYHTGNDLIVLNFKVGIAIYDEDSVDMNALMSHADIALTKAKSTTSHNIVVFDSNMKQHFNHAILLKTSLSKAIQAKKTFMVFQPIVRSSDSSIHGYESLVRWIDDSMGFVSPAKFIPVAESTHLIEPLGDLIIHQVLEFIQTNLESLSADLTFSINISGIQMAYQHFANDFLDLVSLYRVSPTNVAIEITETSLIDDFDMVQSNLLKLKKAGIKIYLDDFGTGYSSLNYLDQLPIDVIKIDQSFCNQVLDNPKKNHLLETIIALAGKLGITTVAEGIETKEQYQHLKSLGIDNIQGYYFSKPLSADSVVSHYAKNENAL